MQFLANLGSTLARLLSRLVLLVAAAVFSLFLLCVALLSLVFVLLKALVTGRKPAFVTTFMQFRQASQQFKPSGWSRQGPAGNDDMTTGTVIEGEVIEVREDRALPQPEDADGHHGSTSSSKDKP